MTLGLSDGVVAAWSVALAVGLVVAIVVWALLEVLRRSVDELRQGVDDLLGHGGRLAQNTWTVALFEQTKARAGELLEELGRHDGGRTRR